MWRITALFLNAKKKENKGTLSGRKLWLAIVGMRHGKPARFLKAAITIICSNCCTSKKSWNQSLAHSGAFRILHSNLFKTHELHWNHSSVAFVRYERPRGIEDKTKNITFVSSFELKFPFAWPNKILQHYFQEQHLNTNAIKPSHLGINLHVVRGTCQSILQKWPHFKNSCEVFGGYSKVVDSRWRRQQKIPERCGYRLVHHTNQPPLPHQLDFHFTLACLIKLHLHNDHSPFSCWAEYTKTWNHLQPDSGAAYSLLLSGLLNRLFTR